MTRYVVIGNGVAGVTAAQAIAQSQPGADLHVYAAEPYPYYRRPQLPDYIAGLVTEDDITYRPPQWYAERGIQVHLNCPVVELDAAAYRLRLADGTDVPYDRLLLAMGGVAWMPPVEGVDRRGVFTLRTLDDARTIRAWARESRQAVVVGGGLLGLETARALRALGLEVTVLEVAPYLMPRQLDREGAAVLEILIHRMGIRTETGVVTEAVLGDSAVRAVRLKDGREFPADLVVFSAGIRPEVTLARQAGLVVNRGVVVDKYLQTSAPDIYAAGDVAEANGIVYGIVPAAIEQARVAAANLVSPGSAVYRGTIPTTTLKVVGAELTSIGECVMEADDLVQLRRADPQQGRYRKLAMRDGRIVGAILLNEREHTSAIRQLLERGTDVSAYTDLLLEENPDWKRLLA
ncbi:MAG: FAD-dependent oxidoreductase [Anaerolineae bacterium]|nr:FAD-dependent oxidoreductase [Anaerolineae bacterium]MCX8068424.1 FAD-dependent oxidoreductase [Anaerolineae bacterium]MDW7991540.1 FAD-dependent oxidoreductase [Anaerolineae bacterium]MDW8068655.1 FAD-dependent oxidoreductase [Anaerolineae bacterium]